jgi:hypothetical protein
VKATAEEYVFETRDGGVIALYGGDCATLRALVRDAEGWDVRDVMRDHQQDSNVRMHRIMNASTLAFEGPDPALYSMLT